MKQLVLAIFAVMGFVLLITELSVRRKLNLLHLIRGARAPARDDIVWYPKIALVRVNRVLCRFCRKGLDDGDLVVWSEKTSGERSEPAHAACAVIVKKSDGTMKLVGGGEPPSTMSPGYLLLTESEWEHWDKQAGVEVGARVGSYEPPKTKEQP